MPTAAVPKEKLRRFNGLAGGFVCCNLPPDAYNLLYEYYGYIAGSRKSFD
jgi:hypothetical protein